MIDALDNVLMDLIQSRAPALPGPIAVPVAFEPPNDDWRNFVANSNSLQLNVYLYDVRENLKLRSNERTFEYIGGWYREHRAPPILNCMYLITGWSNVTANLPAVEPTPDEHALLYSVAEVLLRHRSILIADIYQTGITIPSGRSLASLPPQLQDEELPIEISYAETTEEMLDFWNTMRGAWRPGLKMKVALPVFPVEPPSLDAMVTTLIGDYRQWDHPGSSEVLHTFGGSVLTPPPVGSPPGTPDDPVSDAYVRVLGLTPPAVQIVDRHVITKDDGRFLFSRLQAGQYRLRAISAGRASLQRDIDLPSETGEYDLRFP